MYTFRQILNNKRIKKNKTVKTPALKNSPQKKAVCLKLVIRAPKKPNSALRKLAKLRLTNNKVVYSYIPGEGHNLQEYGVVLVRGGRIKDLPGIKYTLVRNKYDLAGVKNRVTSRSKYGVKNYKKIKQYI